MSTVTDVGQLSFSDLQKEMDRRQKVSDKLQERRAALVEQLAAVEAELSEVGGGNGSASTSNGSSRRGRRVSTSKSTSTTRTPKTSRPSAPKVSGSATRGRRGGGTGGETLVDALVRNLKVGEVSTPQEMSAMVVANGYETSSKNFGIQVANALRTDERFKRIGHGKYERVS